MINALKAPRPASLTSIDDFNDENFSDTSEEKKDFKVYFIQKFGHNCEA